MSLVNAVHELIEVAAGRRNLSGVAADELHAAIDAEQASALPDPGSGIPIQPGAATDTGIPTAAPAEPLPPATNQPAAGAPWQG